MRALSFNAPDDVTLVETPTPEPGPGEALVRIEASAICGSELHARPGENPGHEAAGVVEQAPAGSGFAVGERVGISAVTGCGSCSWCRSGVQLYCTVDRRMHTAMHADRVAVPASALRRVPEGTPARDAVLISGDALGVPVRALRRAPSHAGERVLVLGAGPVGLGHVLVRAHAGAEVVVVEPSAYRRELALRLGATTALEPGEATGAAPALAIECTGIPACIQQALALVEPGGTVLQSGICRSVEVSPTATFVAREVTYTGAWYYADEDYPEIVRLYEQGLPAERLITHDFGAEEISAAYRAFVSKDSGKVVLDWTA
ncbi:zinc-dependent alcohol dehydrogenase [Conexibacter woesei]|uniref:Alcohol dehydrogenase zinc-binding domain protein n=1 Tax=Conexibacter woesei (strain DSM 14684 / CCUG 47730 / CIP 108061 / JCM 11494 / NBRC 100937 / ID131577) TaxID=469383 RepID=D3F387_CONWI|nr:zinc-binding dehydrogenase [Conexibacter woesei]ADB50367.1 Alcohol dehydrogenase zinc-binding domain protein [Conexibacter woesei DSM 14684]